MNRVVIVGASLAGLNAAITLRDEGFEGEVILVGAEDRMPYDRPPLSKEVLTGEMTAGEFDLLVPENLSVEWRLGEPATGLDVARRRVFLNGDEIPYDGLVIATGSVPRRLEGVVPDGERIFELRTAEDSHRLRDSITSASSMIVIGAGFIGMEVASAARVAGLDVTVVSLDPPLAAGGSAVSDAATRLLESNDVTLHAPVALERVRGHDDGVRVEVAGGRLFEAELAVIAVGAVPELRWLEGSGLPIDNGLRCDPSLRVEGVERVTAAGDVARWPNPLYGGHSMRIEHWSNAVEQGMAAARSLLVADGGDVPTYAGLPSFWSDHFGARLQSIGAVHLAERFELLEGEWPDGPFAAKGLRGGAVVAAVAYGKPRALLPFRRLLRNGVQVNAI